MLNGVPHSLLVYALKMVGALVMQRQSHCLL